MKHYRLKTPLDEHTCHTCKNHHDQIFREDECKDMSEICKNKLNGCRCVFEPLNSLHDWFHPRYFEKEDSYYKLETRDGSEDMDKIAYGYGTDWVELSEEHLAALQNGKILQIPENGGEYQMFLCLKRRTP